MLKWEHLGQRSLHGVLSSHIETSKKQRLVSDKEREFVFLYKGGRYATG